MPRLSSWPTTIPHSGDLFDPFDIQAFLMAARVLRFLELRGGKGLPLNDWVRLPRGAPPSLTYTDLKCSTFLSSAASPGEPRMKKGDKSERHKIYDEAKKLIEHYGVERDKVLRTDFHPSFRRDHYANWPYLAAGVCLVVEMAKETRDAVHVVRQRVEGDLNKDLRVNPHLRAVSRFG